MAASQTTASRPRLHSALLRRAGGRLAGAVAVVFGVVTLVFLIGKATGQDASYAKYGHFTSEAERREFRHANGLDGSLLQQYLHYLNRLLHGDLGTSLVDNLPISGQVAKAIPVTASLALAATLVAAVMSTLLGCTAAMFRGRWPDRIVRVFCSLGQSVPTFWIGLIAIQVLAIKFRLVPSGGYVPPAEDVGSWLRSMATPALVLSLPFTAGMTRVMRASMVEELDKDYVRTARGLGLSPREIMLRNVLRNGLVAPITVLGLSLGGLFAGAVLVESVFRLPGIGSLIVTAVAERDFGIVGAASIVAGVAFVTVNLLVDVAQSILNPRPVGEV